MLSGAAASAAGMLSDEGHKDPVVLVHGYAGSVAGQLSVELYWSFIGTRLKLDGYDVYKIALPDAALADVKVSAGKLREFVADVLSKTGKSKVDIVCHSEGGLVARYYIKNLGGVSYVDDLVTISTPHRGTAVAHIGPGEASRQMEIFNPFIRELNTQPTLAGDIDYTAIFSNHDEIVVPGENGFFEGAVNMNVNLLGHAGILFNEPVYDMVKGAISNDVGEGHRAIPIRIVKSKMTTNNPVVTVKFNRFNHYHPGDDVREMKVSNHPFLIGADWESFSDAKTWTLDSGSNGLKAVYVRYKEGKNFLSPKESPVYVDYIFYDTEGPKGKVNIVPDTTLEAKVQVHIDGDDNSDNYKTLKGWNLLSAYGIEDLGVKEMLIGTDPGFSGATWQPFVQDTVVNLGSGSGTKTVYVKLRDGAGNESGVMTDTVRVINPASGDIGMISEPDKEPVVLVHGYMGSTLGDVSVYANWAYIYEKLKSEGFDVYRITLSWAGLQDVKTSAAELKSFVADVLSKTKAKKVDIVCHSEGGLVARYYIKNLGGVSYVDDLVTISTPHRGTTVATIGPGEAARQMEVASPFLQELNSGDTMPGSIEYTALFSHGDEIVVPGKNGFFAGAVNVNYTIFGHAGILFHPDPYTVVKNALAYKYLFAKGIRPVAIRKTGMSTNGNSLTVDLKPCNHYAPQEPATRLLISTDPDFKGASWKSLSSSSDIDISKEKEGLVGVFVKYKGDQGSESPSYADYIIVDRTAPEGKLTVTASDPEKAKISVKIEVSDNAEKYGTFKVTNLLEAYGILGIGAKDMMISGSQNFAGASWVPVAGAADVSVPAGEGEKTVYAKFRDAAGNVSAVVTATARFFEKDTGYMAAEEVKDPVVFVHGYMGSIVGDVSSYINWVYYVEKMKSEGYSTHVITLSDAGMQDVRKSAQELKEFVQKVLSGTSAKKVDIVCHSEGGLVARYYAQNLGGAAYIDDLVTISTPHRGTTVASIGPGMAARQMEVGSDFLKMLNGDKSTFASIDYTAVFSNDDTTIYPPENAFFNGAVNINTNLYNHATILFNDEVYNIVKSVVTLDVGRGADQLPVAINKPASMVISNPNVVLSLNYFNHNAPKLPAGEMMISNDKFFRGASWQPVSNSANWALDGEDGLKAVYVKYRAAGGGTESPAYVDYVVLDRTPPTGAVMASKIENSPDNVMLTITAGDNSDALEILNLSRLDHSYGIPDIGIKDMMIWNSADFTGATWERLTAKKQWPLASGDGDKNVYVKFRDVAGNESQPVVVTIAAPKPVAVVEVKNEEKPATVTETTTVVSDVAAEISFKQGWNLVYIPDDLPSQVRSQIASLFDPSSMVYDLTDMDFKAPSTSWTAAGGRQTWLNLSQPIDQKISFRAAAAVQGSQPALKPIMLKEGWNIVGISTFSAASASDITVTLGTETQKVADAKSLGWLGSGFVDFSADGYKLAEQLMPFHAYLIRANRACLLNLP